MTFRRSPRPPAPAAASPAGVGPAIDAYGSDPDPHRPDLGTVLRARFGIGDFLRRRAGADRAILLAVWSVLLTATTFAAVSVLYADTVASAGLTRSLVRAGPAATDVSITATAAMGELDARAAIVDRELRAALGATQADVLQTIRSSGSYALPGGRLDPDLTVFASVDRLPDLAPLVSGAYPVAGHDPIQAVVTEAAAGALGVGVGDELRVVSRIDAGRGVSAAIVGIVRIPDPTDPRWSTDRLLADGVVEGASFTTIGPLLIDRADQPATGEGRVTLEWHARPDLTRIEPDMVGGLRGGLDALPRRLADQLGGDRAADIDTHLPAVLAAAAGALLVGDTGILLLDLQLAIIGTYALILVAALMREWRQAETALLRSRGAGAEHLVRITAAEALWLVAAAVVIGPVLAWLALSGAAAVGWLGAGARVPALLGGPAVAIVAVAGVLGLLGLVLPTLVGVGPLSAVRRSVGRQVQMTAAHRSGLDLALVVLAAVALWQLRAYGGPLTTSMRGSLGVDPLLVAAPAIGLTAGAILAMRGIPWLARRLAALLERRAGMTGWLGSRELARRPLRFTAPALLLVVATGIGGFSVAYAATWDASQRDQVAHALGAPARLTVPDAGPSNDTPTTWRETAAVAALPGVTAAAPVTRTDFDLGASLGRGEILAVDAEALAAAVALRPDLSTRPVADLAAALIAARPALDLPTLPEGTGALALVVTTDLRTTRTDTTPIDVPADWEGLRGVVVVRDAAGRLARVPGRPTALGDGTARLVVPLRDAAPAGPLELVSIEVEVRMPPSIVAVGSLAIDGLVTGDDAVGGASAVPTPLADVTGPDWRPVRIDAGGDPTEQPGLAIPTGDPLDDPAGARFGLRPAALLPSAATAIPALVDQRLLAATGATVGGTLTIGERFRDPLPVRVVDTVTLVPGTDPARPAALADLATLELVELATHDTIPAAGEWWLTGEGLSTAALTGAATGTQSLAGATAEVATETLAARLEDPIVQGVAGGLLTSALAAGVFALIGLGVSVAVAARERRAEFAILRALGVDRRSMARSIALESGFIVACGIGAGLLVAGILSWVVLPSVGLTTDGQPPVPTARIEWPIAALAVAVLAGLLLWWALSTIARRQVHPERTATTLREGVQ